MLFRSGRDYAAFSKAEPLRAQGEPKRYKERNIIAGEKAMKTGGYPGSYKTWENIADTAMYQEALSILARGGIPPQSILSRFGAGGLAEFMAKVRKYSGIDLDVETRSWDEQVEDEAAELGYAKPTGTHRAKDIIDPNGSNGMRIVQ